MAGRLSDFNPKTNYYSNLTSREKLYSDLDLRMPININTGDVQVYTDIDAIKYSLKNLILSNYYERPFKPFIAGNVTGLLFENANIFTSIQLEDKIRELISLYEKRVKIISVDVDSEIDNNEINVSIQFQIKNEIQEVDIILKRYR